MDFTKFTLNRFARVVLVAGVARVPPWEFVLAVGLGRGVRYFGEGLLALWYGERAAAFISNNFQFVSLGLATLVLILGVGWIWYKKRTLPW